MGTNGTLMLSKEKEVMLYKKSDTSTEVTVGKDKDGAVIFNTQESGTPPPADALAAEGEAVSRGYTEEIEHWAWCIRNPDPENRPRCSPEVAVADAVIALTAKVAIENGKNGKGGYIEFQDDWFDIASDATPDGSSIAEERARLDSFV